MIFIDSDCIIDFLKGARDAVNIVQKHQHELATTQINVFEIFFGIFRKKQISEKELNSVEEFFRSITIFHFDYLCGKMSAKLMADLSKKGKTINQNDCFIGSVMLKNNCKKIITRNSKHFSQIKGIRAVKY